MEYLAALNNGVWVDTEASPAATEQEKEAARDAESRFQQFLTDVLVMDNVMVLTGLGTSLCIKDAGGAAVAPTMADLWTAAEALPAVDFKTVKQKVGYATPDGGDNLELLLSRCQLFQSLKPDTAIRHFTAQAEKMIVAKCRFVSATTDLAPHQGFLRKLARRSTRKPRLKLFTTNYDLCFETAASRSRFVVVDGFAHTSPQEFDGSYFTYDLVHRHEQRDVPDYIPNVFHLYKLHGSVDWDKDAGRITKSADPTNPALIYPRMTKFETSYSQPFLEMISRFQAALRQQNTGLIVVGFGFADDHISQPLLSALAANVGLKILVVDPQVKSSARTAFEQMRSLIAQGDWRLALAQSTFREFVAMVPELVGETQQEQHSARVQRIGGRP